MLEIVISANSVLEIKQKMQGPAVYLDHWALRRFSEKRELRDRLVKAISVRLGTLALSWINLLEFAKVTDFAQGKLAESLIDDLLPNVFFMEANPFKVIDREDILLAGGEAIAPHADSDMLRVLANIKLATPPLLTAQGMISAIQQSGLTRNIESIGDTFVDKIEILRSEIKTNSRFSKAVYRPPTGLLIQRATRYVLKELTKSFLIDQGIPVTRNQALDFYHAVVAVSYCDFVLLDGHWQAQVERMKVQFSKAGMTYPLAKVYSERNNGVESFLSQFLQ